MDAMTKAVKMDLILDHFKEKDEAGDLYVDYDMPQFLPTIGLTYNDDNDYDQILQIFLDKGLIKSAGNGYLLEDIGRDFRNFIDFEIEKLRLNILHEIKPSYFSNNAVDITNLIKRQCPNMPTSDLGLMLQGLSKIGYIFNNGHDFRNLFHGSHNNIRTFVSAGGEVKLKLFKDGYDYLEGLNKTSPKNSNIIHITGNHNNLVNQSTNIKIKNLNNEDVAKLIPELIALIKDMRNTDMDLLIAAVKDHNDGKEINPTAFERVSSLMANLITIATPVLTHGAS